MLQRNGANGGVDLVLQVGCVQRQRNTPVSLSQIGALRSASRTLRLHQQTTRSLSRYTKIVSRKALAAGNSPAKTGS